MKLRSSIIYYNFLCLFFCYTLTCVANSCCYMVLLQQVGADDSTTLDKIIDSLTSIVNISETHECVDTTTVSLKFGETQNGEITQGYKTKRSEVLILGAGRVCRPAAELLASIGTTASQSWLKLFLASDSTEFTEQNSVHVIVASLYLKDAEEVHIHELCIIYFILVKALTIFL